MLWRRNCVVTDYTVWRGKPWCDDFISDLLHFNTYYYLNMTPWGVYWGWKGKKHDGPVCVVSFTFGDSLVTSLGHQGLPRLYEIYSAIRDCTPGHLTNSVAFLHRRSEIRDRTTLANWPIRGLDTSLVRDNTSYTVVYPAIRCGTRYGGVRCGMTIYILPISVLRFFYWNYYFITKFFDILRSIVEMWICQLYLTNLVCLGLLFDFTITSMPSEYHFY